MKRTAFKSHAVIKAVMLTATFFSLVHATIAVRIYSRDEARDQTNETKPRIYIENTGTETLQNFTYRYYFQTEGVMAPVLQDYYIPNEQVVIVSAGNSHYVEYTVTGANLAPGGLLPDNAGNVIGLHYGNYSTWDKINDFSNNLSLTFQENPNITFYYNGTKIYGNEPGGYSGSLLREVWTGISGTSTDDIPLGSLPSISGFQSTLDAPRNIGDNYGVRLRGYITAPATGNYTFWISSDNDSKLFLSTDDDPLNIGAPIARVTDARTGYKEWNAFASQKSAVISIVAGKRYYIEVLHKERSTDDHCTVGWLKPGQSGSVPSEVVPSSVLSPYFGSAVLPDSPLYLVATAASSQRIDISWVNTSNTGTGSEIFMAIGGGGFSSIASVAPNITSYSITGLKPETQYTFMVQAYNTFGSSDPSNAASATTFAVPAGTITREVWFSVTGISVSNIPTSSPADDISQINQLETQQQWNDYYGQRLRGYIIPLQTGSYTFFIASDDESELWLSPSTDPFDRLKIAWVTGPAGYTGYRVWNKFSTQTSSPIELVAGRKYYIEVLHKEGNQNDNLSVAWRLGSSGNPTVITGEVLSPWVEPTIPNDPLALTATPISVSQIDLSWTDNSNNENGFLIERAVGSGTFSVVGTAALHVNVFHDGGLSANTSYRYRIRAFNDEGYSGYSNIASATTLTQIPEAPFTVDLLPFSVFSSEKTLVNERSTFSGGGAVGSNLEVELKYGAVVTGNVISGGDIIVRTNAQITGNAMAAGTVTAEAGASIGTIYNGATVATVTIPQKAGIITGTEDISIGNGETRVLTPGYYKDLIVETGGILSLSGGSYSFTRFMLQSNAEVVLNVTTTDLLDIDVAGDLQFGNSSKILISGDGYVPFIRIYTNDNNNVTIGSDVLINGTISAPNAHVILKEGGTCNGALFAKKITIEQDVQMNSEIVDPDADYDGDHVANILEIVMGTLPYDPTSYYPIAIPSKAFIDNTEDVTITYDFSKFFPDYTFATAVPVTFPAGTLTRPDIPILISVTNMPSEGGVFTAPDHKIRGRYFSFRSENSINPAKNFSFRLPMARSWSSFEKKAYQHPTTVTPTSWVQKAAAPPGGGNESEGIDLTVSSTNTLAAADRVKTSTATLYFDNEIVFKKDYNAQNLNYNISISDVSEEIEWIKMNVDYTDKVTNTSSTEPIILAGVPTGQGLRCFSKCGRITFTNPVQIDRCVFTTRYTSSTEVTFSQNCGPDFTIGAGQIMQLLVKSTPDVVSGKGTAKDPVALYYAGDFTFESANFSDGRIVGDYSGVTPPFSYDYFLKDHLGSTRMAADDNGTFTEAIMYQPYGMMSDVPGASSAPIPVREKFTGKEFDEEGTASPVTFGIRQYYFGARYYDPEMGIWFSIDPKRQFWNTYGYTSNPLLFVDPKGETVHPANFESRVDWLNTFFNAAISGDLETVNIMADIELSNETYIYVTAPNMDVLNRFIQTPGLDPGVFGRVVNNPLVYAIIGVAKTGASDIDRRSSGYIYGIIKHEIVHAGEDLSRKINNNLEEERLAHISQYELWREYNHPDLKMEANYFLSLPKSDQIQDLKSRGY